MRRQKRFSLTGRSFKEKPRRRAAHKRASERYDAENRAAALIILRNPEVHGEGLCQWARLTLRRAGRVPQNVEAVRSETVLAAKSSERIRPGGTHE